MSVLIRGMDMPTNCGLCGLWMPNSRDGDYCTVTMKKADGADKPRHCPLFDFPNIEDAIPLFDDDRNVVGIIDKKQAEKMMTQESGVTFNIGIIEEESACPNG